MSSNAPTREQLRQTIDEKDIELREIQAAYSQMSITVDSLKQRVFDLDMQIVDKQSELMVTQAQLREMQVAAQRPPAPAFDSHESKAQTEEE